jgi:hypothetical protein
LLSLIRFGDTLERTPDGLAGTVAIHLAVAASAAAALNVPDRLVSSAAQSSVRLQPLQESNSVSDGAC